MLELCRSEKSGVKNRIAPLCQFDMGKSDNETGKIIRLQLLYEKIVVDAADCSDICRRISDFMQA